MAIKLSNKKCKLVAELWAAGLLQNHEAHFVKDFLAPETENQIVDEIFVIADKLQKEHPKYGSVYDIVNYVNQNSKQQ